MPKPSRPEENISIGPTRPHVPIPEETGAPFISSLKTQVEIGPIIADVIIGATHIFGFLQKDFEEYFVCT